MTRSLMRVSLFVAALAGSVSRGEIVTVRDSDGLKRACASAVAGTVIRLAPGDYAPGVFVVGKNGEPGRPITIEGADADALPVFTGGVEALHFVSCSHIVLRNLVVRGQKDNGLNADDGGKPGTAHHIAFENVRIEDIGPQGNHDGIKLSGLDDFAVRNCTFHGWGGQGVDMVGCHRGIIEDCSFRGKKGFSGDTGVTAKGGSSDVTVRRCAFDHAASRGVNAGGFSDFPFYRPLDAPHEAAAITVEGCTFHGGEAPIAFVGCDGAVFRFNTVYDPGKWICRILQERTKPRLARCRDGRIERNIFVFRAAKVGDPVNIGPETKPESFVFRDNLWFAMDKPAASRLRLPTQEQGGVHGIDPKLDAPDKGSFKPLAPQAVGYGATAFRPAAKR